MAFRITGRSAHTAPAMSPPGSAVTVREPDSEEAASAPLGEPSEPLPRPATSVFCIECGEAMQADDRFCGACGTAAC